MSTLLTLGARHWINHNQNRAEELSISDSNIATDTDVLEDFMPDTGVTRQNLVDRGRYVQRVGYEAKLGTKELKYNETLAPVSILRPIGPKSLALDGRMPQTDQDNSLRYRIPAATQGNNTCATDVALFAAIRLDLGRTQVDQLTLRQVRELEQAPRMVRSMLSQEWSTLSTRTRDEQRDLLACALAEYPTLSFPLGQFLSVAEVVDVCFRGFPQLCYTSVVASVCCDHKPRPNHTMEVSHEHSYAFSGEKQTVQEDIANAFAVHRLPPSETTMPNCSKGNECKKRQWGVKLVLDRLPPVLMVTLAAPLVLSSSNALANLTNIRFSYMSRSGPVRVEYEVVGCIMLVGKSHYIARWRAERPSETMGKIISFDGMPAGTGRITWLDNWYGDASGHRRTRRTGLVAEVVFYRQVFR